MSSDMLRSHLIELLAERADRVAGGQLTEHDPLELIVSGESVRARVYTRYNGRLVLALDAYADDVVETDALNHWIATRSGVMPFAALHIDRPLVPGTAPTVLYASHTLVADTVTGAQLDEVLDGLTYMARRARSRAGELAAEADEDFDDLHGFDDDLDDLDDDCDDDCDGDQGADGPADEPAGMASTGAASGDASVPPTDADDVGDAGDDRGDDERPGGSDPDEVVPVIEATTVVGTGSGRRMPAGRTVDEVLADLHALVGLGPVKAEVQRLISAQQAAELRRVHGLAGEQPSPHLVFVGNPGTGKTTVARLVGELYRAIGLLPSGHLVETERAGLVAAFVGQTALKTKKVCESALGGVLFIDEAYSLTGHDRDYGAEAIDTILTFMENHRGELAVVVAGYPTKMTAFLDSNPGLRSRFDLVVEFPDYSTDELEQIFLDLAWSNDYDVVPEVLARISAFIAAWPRNEHFGNGREVRKLFTEITRRHADLLFRGRAPGEISTAQLRQLRLDAVPTPPVYRPNPRRGEDHGYL